MWRSNSVMYVTVPYNEVLFSILYFFFTCPSEVDFGIAYVYWNAENRYIFQSMWDHHQQVCTSSCLEKSININISYKIMSESRRKYQKIRPKENLGNFPSYTRGITHFVANKACYNAALNQSIFEWKLEKCLQCSVRFCFCLCIFQFSCDFSPNTPTRRIEWTYVQSCVVRLLYDEFKVVYINKHN